MDLTGSICALATPFTADGVLDLAAWTRLLEHQIAGGTQAVVVAGSTGEAHALDAGEYDRLLDAAVQTVAGRIPVVAGTGTANTRKTVIATQRARALGADAALVVTPYYVRPPQEGLRRHYLAVADDGGLPVIAYNVPGRTGCNMQPETVAAIASHPHIIGIKEACSDVGRVEALLALRSDTFRVLSGDDGSCARSMLVGVDGVISVANNAFPHHYRRLCDFARGGQRDETEALDHALHPLADLLGVESNPIPLKWCLHVLGICGPHLRLPLLCLSEAHREPLRRVVDALRAAGA